MSVDALLQALVSGLLMGAAYALIAVGFTLISGVMRIINFAHGHIVMVAMFGSYALYKYFSLDPYISLAVLLPAFLLFGMALSTAGSSRRCSMRPSRASCSPPSRSSSSSKMP